jgi:hypothetical protein
VGVAGKLQAASQREAAIGIRHLLFDIRIGPKCDGSFRL